MTDLICGYIIETCKAIAELIILTAFSVALVVWMAHMFAPDTVRF